MPSEIQRDLVYLTYCADERSVRSRMSSLQIPPEVQTVEAYYFGCWGDTGHYWWRPSKERLSFKDAKDRFPTLYVQIDTGFCPKNTQREGVCTLNHIDGYTILSFWDRSVDTRPGSNSNFIVEGTFSFVEMISIAKAQYPMVFRRYTFGLHLANEWPDQ